MSYPNLLVVDWDFFFPNPLMSTAKPDERALLYDWSHREAPIFLSPLVWSSRAAAFLGNGMELPTVQGWDGFWERFRIDPDAPVLYGDSNVHAGRLLPDLVDEFDAPGWHTVSLWDAHHDSGYTSTVSLERWRAQDRMTCEDWMLLHHDRGSRLEVTYPAWRGAVGTIEPEPLVPVDRRVDDGTNPDTLYDAVYVCRSGAWVPPWCDPQFSEFLEQIPNAWVTEVPGNEWEQPRPSALAEARHEIEVRARMDALTGAHTEEG